MTDEAQTREMWQRLKDGTRPANAADREARLAIRGVPGHLREGTYRSVYANALRRAGERTS